MRRSVALTAAVLGVLLTLAPATPARAVTPAAPSVCSMPQLPSSRALRTLRARVAAATTTPVRILALGSSTTYGMGLSDRSQRWPDRLAAALPGKVSMVDGAVPGAIAPTYVALDLVGLLDSRLHGRAPAVVLHMIGSNDYWLHESPELYADSLRLDLDVLDAQTPQPVHVFISTYRDPDTKRPSHPWSAYRAVMRKVVSEDPAHRLYVDLTPWFDRAQVPGADPNGYLDAGGVHPSAKGQATIARLVLRALGYGC